MGHRVTVGRAPTRPVIFANDGTLNLIAGPCQLESRDMCLRIAEYLSTTCEQLGIGYVFKGSFDKANRTSGGSERGPGISRGLEILWQVRSMIGCPVTTDIHTVEQAWPASGVADLIQIPALLSRQTDLIAAAGLTERPVNIKKGQFMAPEDMGHAARKVGRDNVEVLLTDRGTSFGYHNLVADMRSLAIMKATGHPVIMDASHACQAPSTGERSGGDRAMVPVLARAGVAVGIAGVFIECHPDPDHAMSDGATSMHLSDMSALLAELIEIDAVVKHRHA